VSASLQGKDQVSLSASLQGRDQVSEYASFARLRSGLSVTILRKVEIRSPSMLLLQDPVEIRS